MACLHFLYILKNSLSIPFPLMWCLPSLQIASPRDGSQILPFKDPEGSYLSSFPQCSLQFIGFYVGSEQLKQSKKAP
jgi:hypothetical protein